MGIGSQWPKGVNSYCWQERGCGEAGEGAAVGLGMPQSVGWGPKEPAGTCIPLGTMVGWRRKRRKALVFLYCFISGAFLNPGLELQLGPKKCFMSRELSLRLLFVLVHCPQQERAGELRALKPMAVTVSWVCTASPGLLCCAVLLLPLLLLCCWVHPSLPLPTQHRSPQ